MKIYYIIPTHYRLTGHPENFKIKLYYFQERLSLRYNIIPKSLSLLYMFKKTNFQKDLFFKECFHSQFYFLYYRP